MRIFFILTLLLFTLDAKSLFSNSNQADNSKYIGALKDLVIATQKTRGLTNNFLNGNTTSMLLVYGTRLNMKKSIGTMESLPLASDPIINNRATTISQSLIQLNRKAFKKVPSEVFEEYTELIEQTLMLAQTVSKRGSKDLNPIGKSLSTIMMEVILPYTEYIGQMRGMGSGIVAKGKSTKMQQAQMLAIINEIETLSAEFTIRMEGLITTHSKSFNPSLNTDLEEIKRATKIYIKTTKTEVLKEGKLKLDTDDYFYEGTDIISHLIKVYNINNQIILEDSKGWI